MTIRFPYARQSITPADVAAVAAAVEGRLLTQGPVLESFEAALADTLGARHAVVCNSGTAALHLACLALELGPKRGLVTSPITFLATANAARMCDAPVAFADVDPATGNMDVEAARSALESAPFPVAALAPVHLGGRACDMAALKALADAQGCAVIEDACHAPLAAYRDRHGGRHSVGACAHSDIAVFSFHAIKHVAMAEGGALVTNSDAIAARARRLRSHGMSREPSTWRAAPEPDAPWYYEMHEVGWNYRASELHCALGLSQLARLPAAIARRRAIAARYDQRLGNLRHLALPAPRAHADEHVWHLYAVAVDFAALGRTRGQVMRDLADRGVGTQVHYIPVNRQPYYADRGARPLPGADAYYARTLSLPIYVGLDDRDVDEIADAVRSVLEGRSA
jgi:UDP-4-amino-4,6-dideoxy-N-acetyl-beta-L-altrosamine transaminase